MLCEYLRSGGWSAFALHSNPISAPPTEFGSVCFTFLSLLPPLQNGNMASAGLSQDKCVVRQKSALSRWPLQRGCHYRDAVVFVELESLTPGPGRLTLPEPERASVSKHMFRSCLLEQRGRSVCNHLCTATAGVCSPLPRFIPWRLAES